MKGDFLTHFREDFQHYNSKVSRHSNNVENQNVLKNPSRGEGGLGPWGKRE